MPTGNYEREQYVKLLTLLKQAIEQDEKLRVKYSLGDKFKFIRDKLRTLFAQVEAEVSDVVKEVQLPEKKLQTDEISLYVYLYNAKGALLSNWQPLLTPSVFYEYSVNRPIFKDKKMIAQFIKAKANPLQHGYLTIAVHPNDVLETYTDSQGADLVRVKEGSLHYSKLLKFTHNEQNYIVDSEGRLVKDC